MKRNVMALTRQAAVAALGVSKCVGSGDCSGNARVGWGKYLPDQRGFHVLRIRFWLERYLARAGVGGLPPEPRRAFGR